MAHDAPDILFQALANPTRRAIIDLVVQSPGLRVADVADHFEMSRIAVMKHLKILEQGDLLLTKKTGRERRHYFNAVPIQRLCDQWTDRYSAFFAQRLSDIKDRVETPRKEPKRA